MKTKHERYHPRIVKYGDYKNSDTKLFKNRLKMKTKHGRDHTKIVKYRDYKSYGTKLFKNRL